MIRTGAAAPFLYERVAAEMGDLIERGTFRPGDRLPSIRELARQRRISINTALQVFAELEDRRLVEVRPQSGAYVAARLAEGTARRALAAREVTLGREPLEIMRNLGNPELVPLGRSAPDVALLPAE